MANYSGTSAYTNVSPKAGHIGVQAVMGAVTSSTALSAGDAFAMCKLPKGARITNIRCQGAVVGTSAGINIAAAIRVAKAMGPGHTIVTILCDGGSRYQSKLFNPDFLRSKNLPVPSWLA